MKIKNISACAMATVVVTACLTGCGVTAKVVEQVDSSKSTLSVGIFKAGLGTTWLENSAKDFEEYYANTSFEKGKTGVQVLIQEKTEEFKASNLSATMTSLDNAIYFLEQSDYNMFLSKDLLLDITDVINADVYDKDGNLASQVVVADDGSWTVQATGEKSIMDTMSAEFVGYHDYNGKYMALPFRTHVGGIVYDADLFNENRYYFKANGELGATQADIDSGNCGTGPDGKMGTTDDGMPVKYSDFIKLIKAMTSDNVIPFTWANTTYQNQYVYNSIWANYQGYDDYLLNWTLDGTTTDGQVVNEQNFGTVLAEQQGRKAGIQFYHDIMEGTNKYHSPNVFIQAHTEAEYEYIKSVEGKNGAKRIAMFMEGGYWENEARDYFDSMEKTNADWGYGKRNFRLMPIPNFVGVSGITDQTNTAEPEVLLGYNNDSMICLAKKFKADNMELQSNLAKLFLQFVQSREQLSNFTRDTGACFRTYDFEPTETELASWTKFAQSVYGYMQEGSRIIPDISRSTVRQDVAANSGYAWSFKYTPPQGVAIVNPAVAFNKYESLTVDDCYAKVQQYIRSLK